VELLFHDQKNGEFLFEVVSGVCELTFLLENCVANMWQVKIAPVLGHEVFKLAKALDLRVNVAMPRTEKRTYAIIKKLFGPRTNASAMANPGRSRRARKRR
jgi:hypothetical protein